MNLCIIGNSHVGSLKRAWPGSSSPHKATFFASRGNGLLDLVVKENSLAPRTEALRKELLFTSGGLEAITPEAFDAVILYGLDCRHYFPRDQFYSEAVQASAIKDHFRIRIAAVIFDKVRAVTGKPILIGHEPLPVDPRMDSQPPMPDTYLKGVALANRYLFNRLRSELIAQPVETMAGDRFTLSRHTKGSRRLEIGDEFDGTLHDDNDTVHMNEGFGTLWLSALFQRLRLWV